MTYEEAIESLRYCHSLIECEECIYYDVRGFCTDMDSEISWDVIIKHHDKYRWHNLIKNPNDLPDSSRLVDCRTTDKQPFYYGNYDSEFGTWYDSEGFSMQVVAWREAELFEEVEE